MTTVWRPRVRIDVPDVGDAEKTDTSREKLTNKGTKRKRAPRHYGPCEHGVKPRSKCKVCSACPHGRERSHCKECGGGSICEHGRERSGCKECGGASICEHGRVRSICKECGGSAICEHGRQRPTCRSAVGHRYASTIVSAMDARSAVGLESASTIVSALCARIAKGHQSASTDRARRFPSHRILCTDSAHDVGAMSARNAPPP